MIYVLLGGALLGGAVLVIFAVWGLCDLLVEAARDHEWMLVVVWSAAILLLLSGIGLGIMSALS